MVLCSDQQTRAITSPALWLEKQLGTTEELMGLWTYRQGLQNCTSSPQIPTLPNTVGSRDASIGTSQ